MALHFKELRKNTKIVHLSQSLNQPAPIHLWELLISVC